MWDTQQLASSSDSDVTTVSKLLSALVRDGMMKRLLLLSEPRTKTQVIKLGEHVSQIKAQFRDNSSEQIQQISKEVFILFCFVLLCSVLVTYGGIFINALIYTYFLVIFLMGLCRSLWSRCRENEVLSRYQQ